jgi:hypothetical protein
MTLHYNIQGSGARTRTVPALMRRPGRVDEHPTGHACGRPVRRPRHHTVTLSVVNASCVACRPPLLARRADSRQW